MALDENSRALRLEVDLTCRIQKPVGPFVRALALSAGLTTVCCTHPAPPTNNPSNASQNVSQSKAANDNAPAKTEQKSTGTIEVSSSPSGARVLLVSTDEGGAGEPQARGTTPTTISGLNAGKYTVDLEKPGYRFFQKDVAVKEGKTVQINAALKKK